MAPPPVSYREFGFRHNRRGSRAAVSENTHSTALVHTVLQYSGNLSSSSLVSKALQEFDLALRGKKKRERFLKDGGKKKELTVPKTRTKLINQYQIIKPECVTKLLKVDV